ncbi:type II secretion system protein [bacterium]|nr:type II secretion system protein [bacterium]
MNIEEQKARGQEGKPISSLNTLAPCGRGQGEGSKSLHKTLSRICMFAYCSLTNSTLSQRERVNSKAAFTLAEVLITLGIIGVVAAMTLPSLIQKHQERVTVNKVKKFYSVMSQAQLLAIKDHGYLDEWDVPDGTTKESAEKFMSYLKPYLKIARDCGTSAGCLEYSQTTVKYLNGTPRNLNYDTNNKYYKLILNDGTYMWLRTVTGAYCANPESKESCATVWIDVNGKNPPNTIGRDIFNFGINKNNVRPTGNNGDCRLNGAGWSCAEYVLQGNMDYLKK